MNAPEDALGEFRMFSAGGIQDVLAETTDMPAGARNRVAWQIVDHLAQVLAEYVAEREAQALLAAGGDLRARFEYGLLTPDECEWAETWLRARAQALRAPYRKDQEADRGLDDALIAKAAEALLRERRRRWDHVHQGECITDARAVVAAVRDQIAAEALREVADACDRDARWVNSSAWRAAYRNRAAMLRARAEAVGATESAGEAHQAPEMAPESDAGAETAVRDGWDAAGNSEGES